MSNKPGFNITSGKGFHVTFENGFTVSVQFGYGNYCENRNGREHVGVDLNEISRMQASLGAKGSASAEVAVWGPDQAMLKIGEFDEVRGWVSPEQVALILSYVSAFNPIEGPFPIEALMKKLA